MSPASPVSLGDFVSELPATRSVDSDKQAIITADDFGLSREVNAGVIQAHREGVLTAASLMVAGAARDEAAILARENPGLDVGLHLVVCRGGSVLPGSQLHGLTDSSGRFAENAVMAGMRYFFKRRIRPLIRDEIRAQIDHHLEQIGALNHIDGHLNFHVHPVIADMLIEFAVEYGLPCIRLPREPVFTTLRLARDHASRKLIEAVIFRALSRRTRRMAAERGILSTDRLFGLHQSGHLSEAYVIGVIARLGPGLTELYFHPAQDIGGTPPSAQAQRETAILTSAAVRAALEAGGVRLTNFAAVTRSRASSTSTTRSG
jgi:chitin disaccharide deacetylase